MLLLYVFIVTTLHQSIQIDMKLSICIRENFQIVVSYLYILLFVYAGVIKFLTFDDFQAQLGHSPLISIFATPVSYSVIIAEIGIAVLLSINKYRIVGLYMAFSIMVIFSSYIFIILNYSPYIPCSCGGILEKMGWKEHLIFNLAFVVAAVIALFVANPVKPMVASKLPYYIAARLLALTTISCGLVTILYIKSDELLHTKNGFVRYVPPAPKQAYEAELKFNSYYFAGEGNGKIYLGNVTAPAHVLEFDIKLKTSKAYTILLKDSTKFKAVRIHVQLPYFYVMDGLVPSIFRGKITDWNATQKLNCPIQFTASEILDSSSVACRTLSKKNGGNILALFNLKSDSSNILKPGLLQRQIDGIFDTDGTLQYSSKSKRFVYLYYYRNQYIVTDKNLNLLRRGKTIDTTSKARIKITYVKSKDEKQFSAPPFIVNRRSTLRNNLLFVNSSLRGRFDTKRMWNDANFIDVYDIEKDIYLMSFYVYKINGEQLNHFIVTDTHLYALIGTRIVLYELSTILRDAMKPYTAIP